LNAINQVILIASLMYFLITLILPLDWVFKLTSTAENPAANRQEDFRYPCDMEEEEVDTRTGTATGKYLLTVNALTQVYPDGTPAVKDMSFKIKQGEVLSFLGANGAGA
jgi:ABC-type multidrug transport system fused ATPase/permease subunit